MRSRHQFVGVLAVVVLALALPATEVAATSRRPHAVTSAVGRALSAAQARRLTQRVGTRARAGRPTDAAESTNWSGLAEVGSGFEGVSGTWVVPTVQEADSPDLVAEWVGVDGDGNESLIQTGTAEDSFGDTDAWFELLPEDPFSVGIANAPVMPGDTMVASIHETATSGVWEVYLADTTQDWYFDQTMAYSGPETSAEWVVEAPTTYSGIAALANFGTTTFEQTSVYGDLGPSGTTWYGTDMDATNEIDMVDPATKTVIAYPSAPTTDAVVGQDFTDTYQAPPTPPAPPMLRELTPTSDYQLSTVIDVNYTATDATSPIASFDVRYRAEPWNRPSAGGYVYPPLWQGTRVRHQTLIGHPGEQYCFSLRVHTKAGQTSHWSADRCTSIPLGALSLRTLAPHQWVKAHAPGYFLNSYAVTSVAGAQLELNGSWGQLDLIATECPTCGIVQVWANGALVAQFNTHADTVEHHHVFRVPTFPYARTRVIVKNLVPHETAIIEGVAVL